jgi:SpoVK/Ycf46/Vps4 family AAA+-type ATPase
LIRPGRIDRKIYVPPPDDQSRAQILTIQLKKMPKSFTLPSYQSLSLSNQVDKKEKGEREVEREGERQGERERNSNNINKIIETTVKDDDGTNLYSFGLAEDKEPNLSDLNKFKFKDLTAVKQPQNMIQKRIQEENEKKEKEKKDKFERELNGKELFLELIRRTSGFSGAEMVALVQEAGMLAIDEGGDLLDSKHLFYAIDHIKPQITKEMLLFYENIVKTY